MSDPSAVTELGILKVLRNGRRRYDPACKQRLVEACLQPGVSVAGLALQHGVNANLLRKWVTERRQPRGCGMAMNRRNCMPGPFMPVIEVGEAADPSEAPALAPPEHPGDPARAMGVASLPAAKLTVEMPNGVRLRLECTRQDGDLVSAMIVALGRRDVPAGC
jgi:transposase